MTLLHLSLPAAEPECVAGFLAQVMGGTVLPFPPVDGAWIAFADADDGTAIEVYPDTTRIRCGDMSISFGQAVADRAPSAVHTAIGSVLPASEVISRAEALGWVARTCNRGPFHCVEVWIDGVRLVEILDTEMLAAYRANMSTKNWRAMFGFDEEENS